MDGVFIGVQIDESVAADSQLAERLTEICPVDIFAQTADGTLELVEANLDECVLCRLCIEASPAGAVKILKRYSEETLE